MRTRGRLPRYFPVRCGNLVGVFFIQPRSKSFRQGIQTRCEHRNSAPSGTRIVDQKPMSGMAHLHMVRSVAGDPVRSKVHPPPSLPPSILCDVTCARHLDCPRIGVPLKGPAVGTRMSENNQNINGSRQI